MSQKPQRRKISSYQIKNIKQKKKQKSKQYRTKRIKNKLSIRLQHLSQIQLNNLRILVSKKVIKKKTFLEKMMKSKLYHLHSIRLSRTIQELQTSKLLKYRMYKKKISIHMLKKLLRKKQSLQSYKQILKLKSLQLKSLKLEINKMLKFPLLRRNFLIFQQESHK